MAAGGLGACSANIHFSRLGGYDETGRAIGGRIRGKLKGGFYSPAFAPMDGTLGDTAMFRYS